MVWQSLLGILLGVGVGGLGLLVWLLFPGAFSTQPPSTTNPQTRPSTQLTTDEQIYRRCQQEARKGSPGAGFRAMEQRGSRFPLRAHLVWQLAQSYIQQRRYQLAFPLFDKLLKMKQNLWSRKQLYYKLALYHWYNAKQKKSNNSISKKYLEASLKEQPLKGKLGPYQHQQESLSAAAALLFYAAHFAKPAQKLSLYEKVWLDHPSTNLAWQGESKWWKLFKESGYPLPKVQLPRLFRAIKLYLRDYRNQNNAQVLLRKLKRRYALSRSWKIRWMRLQTRVYRQSGQWRKEYKSLASLAGLLAKKKRYAVYFDQARVALEHGSMRRFKRSFRKLRRRRYWRGKAYLAQARWYFQNNRWRKALKYFQKAWRARRDKAFRTRLLLEIGLLYLHRKKTSKAKRYLAKAFGRFRKAPAEYAYWLARAEEASDKQNTAIFRYQKLHASGGLSYYGLLAARQLERLSKLKAMTLSKPKHAHFRWQPEKLKRWNSLRLLAQHGPKELYLLELERIAIQQRKPSVGLLLEMARLGEAHKAYDVGPTWLAPRLQRYLDGRPAPTQQLLIHAFPCPAPLWTLIVEQARKQKLDPRQISTVVYLLSKFRTNFARGLRLGLMGLDPFWATKLPERIKPNLALGAAHLHKLQNKLKSPELALLSYLHPLSRVPKRIARRHRRSPKDLRFFLLPHSFRDALRVYWTYQFLYIVP